MLGKIKNNIFHFQNVLEYTIFTSDFHQIKCHKSSEPKIINTINAYSFQVANQDVEFKSALQNSDYLLPDGVGIVLATKLLNGIKIKKYSGYELHTDILNHYNKTSGKVFYFGSSDSTLLKIKERVAKEFPNISVAYLSPPFKERFTPLENINFTQTINAFNPDVVFVGMTAPKQEKWIYENNEKIYTSYICAIGAVFDFYAGTIKKPNKLLVKLGLEWLARLINNPTHMIKRYRNFPITQLLISILKEKYKK